jgi:hypothetical protein
MENINDVLKKINLHDKEYVAQILKINKISVIYDKGYYISPYGCLNFDDFLKILLENESFLEKLNSDDSFKVLLENKSFVNQLKKYGYFNSKEVDEINKNVEKIPEFHLGNERDKSIDKIDINSDNNYYWETIAYKLAFKDHIILQKVNGESIPKLKKYLSIAEKKVKKNKEQEEIKKRMMAEKIKEKEIEKAKKLLEKEGLIKNE